MIIQVCFQVKDDTHNNMVIEKLQELKGRITEEDLVISCHLPKHIIEEKGFDPKMTDALNSTFAGQYKCYTKADTFAEAMKNINSFREKAAYDADKIFIIGEQSIANIALEIELFTNSMVEFL